MVNDSKEIVSSRYNRVGSLMNSWMLWQNAQDLHNFKQDRIPAWRKGRDTKPRPNQKAIYICWERENQCFLMGYHWVYQHTPGQVQWPGVVGQYKIDTRFLCVYAFLFWFGIFYLLFVLIFSFGGFVFVLFCSFWEKEKTRSKIGREV